MSVPGATASGLKLRGVEEHVSYVKDEANTMQLVYRSRYLRRRRELCEALGVGPQVVLVPEHLHDEWLPNEAPRRDVSHQQRVCASEVHKILVDHMYLCGVRAFRYILVRPLDVCSATVDLDNNG